VSTKFLIAGIGLVVALGLAPTQAVSGEYSAITQSSIVGSNYGVTPRAATGDLEILSEAVFFFKNLELFNLDFVLGETVIGYRLPLRARYQPHAKVALELGVLLGRDFGDAHPLNRAVPLVRLTYTPAPGLAVLAGNIMPTHWISDAVLDDMWRYRQTSEEGFQLRADRAGFKSDSWINWRQREGVVIPEEFEIGMSHQIRLWRDIFRLNVQGMWNHAGGQISLSRRVEQDVVYAVGFSVGTQHPRGATAIEDVRCGWMRFTSRYEDDRTPLGENQARAWTAHTDVRVQRYFLARFFGERYRGDGLTALRGDPLYQLDRYDQLGLNLLFEVGTGMTVEAGFVNQWTGDAVNLTYQLTMAWGGRTRLTAVPREAPPQMGPLPYIRAAVL